MTCLEQEQAIAIDGTYMLVGPFNRWSVLHCQPIVTNTPIRSSIVQLNPRTRTSYPLWDTLISAFILWHSVWIRPLLIERILCHGLGMSLSCPIGLILVVKVRSLAWRNCEQEGMQAFPRLTRKLFNTQAMEPLSTSAATPWASYQKGLGHSCRKS
jgi:hypothetical protein